MSKRDECGVMAPHDLNAPWRCERKPGHGGLHVACGTSCPHRCPGRVTRSDGSWLPCELPNDHGVIGGMGCMVQWGTNPEPIWNPRDIERRKGERRLP